MLRTSALALITLALLARTSCPLSCVPETPCEYETFEIDADYLTWSGTTVGEDLVWLEQPQVGVWRWGDSSEYILVEQSGVERPAIATFTADPEGLGYTEHVGGGHGQACASQGVEIEGTLTITDAEDDSIIVSVPLTIKNLDSGYTYSSSPTYSPISEFSPELEELAEWDRTLVFGSILWADRERLLIEFYYFTQTMYSQTQGGGAGSLVGQFVPES